MSLACYEHLEQAPHFLTVHDTIFCVTTAEDDDFTAICCLVVDAIPNNLRLARPVRDGVDVHSGSSTPNLPHKLSDHLSYRGFTIGDRLFSITRQTARLYMPRTAGLY